MVVANSEISAPRPIAVSLVMGLAIFNLRSCRMKLHQPNIGTFIVGVVTLLSMARCIVSFCEAYTFLAAERISDMELLRLCDSGAASESLKFRDACIHAKASRSSPLMLKALLRCIKLSFVEFSEQFTSPTRVIILVLFCVSGLALPVVKAMSSLATAHLHPQALERLHGLQLDGPSDPCEVVMMDGLQTSRLRKAINQVRRQRPMLKLIDEDDSEWANVNHHAKVL